ncbi:MAG: phosphonate ABC transporter, permease protein PhnE, partial [Alphaproteobacteria bacterium]|nr:phosphonate ABC transporter, permease protein PhnE [Alphaproteobacteria bacterium]
MSPGRPIFAGDVAAVLERHRALIELPWHRRAAQFCWPLAILGAAVFSVWWLGITFAEIGPGLVELAKFVGLMLPPTTGGHLLLFLRAMGETLAIAFLGTLIAATLAAPLGLLAARNTTPSLAL